MDVVLVACALFALQSLLSFIQISYYRKHMNNITHKYSNSSDYYLYSSMEKKKFGSSAIAVIVVDKENIIKECQILQGKSIFAQFKTLSQFHGQSLVQILNIFEKEKSIRSLSLWEKAIITTANRKLCR